MTGHPAGNDVRSAIRSWVSRVIGARIARPRPRYDVLFYMPWIGSLLAPDGDLPPGGAETQILLLSRELAARGIRVAVAVFDRPGGLPALWNGVHVIVRRPYGFPRDAFGRLIEMFVIWALLWRARAAIIVKRGAGLDVLLVGVIARLTRRQFVFSSANDVDFTYEQLFPNRVNVLLCELGIRLAQTIVVQTEVQVDLCRARFGRSPVLIKSLAEPVGAQQETAEAFIWIGRLVFYKRPLVYVELARSMPHARFWLVGVPTPHGEAGERLAAEVATAASDVPNLQLLEPRPRPELMLLMDRAVASVNTADYEGMPNTFLEAWSRGVPALALSQDPGGVIARHGLGAFADGSSARLRAEAEELWLSRGSRDQLADRCRAYVAREHAPPVVTTQWIDTLGVGWRANATPPPVA